MPPLTLWEPPPLSERSLAAIERLALPSLAQPLPRSVRIGLTRWLYPGSRAEAEAAFRGGTGLPPGATVAEASDGVLVVEGPFLTSGIFLTDDAGGCAYSITPGPSLIVEGAGPVPSGSAFCRVAPSMMDSDPEGRTIICEAELGGATWTIMVVTPDGNAPSQGVLAKATLAAANGEGFNGTKVQGTAKLERAENGAVVAVIATDAGPVRVVAFQTDAIFALIHMTPATRTATCKLSKKGGSPPSAPTLTCEGFDPGETVEITFEGAELSTAKADEAGAFHKRVTIPPEAVPGPHMVVATGKKSALVVETPFRVLKVR